MGNDRSSRTGTVPKVTLHILRGKATRRSREMRGSSLLIGSEPHCDVQMRSTEVAGKHCLISIRAGRVLASQLDPDFPILLNGSAVTETELCDGDKLSVGPFELSVSVESPALAAAPERPDAVVEEPNRPAEVSFVEPDQGKQIDDLLAGLQKLQSQPAPARTPSAPAEATTFVAPRVERPEPIAPRASTIRPERRERTEDHGLEESLEKARQLAAREKSLRQSEQEIERQRMALTEDLIRLDRRQQSFERDKGKLLRVRRRLFDHYRGERDAVVKLVAQADTRAGAVQEQRRELDREITHWKRVGEELGRRQADLKQQATELAARVEEIERRERETSLQRAKLEQESGALVEREQSLQTYKTDLDQRKVRIAEEEAGMRQMREATGAELQKAKDCATEAKRRHDEVETKAKTLEKQEQHLREQAKSLEEQRKSQAQRDRETAARVALLTEREAFHQAEEQRFGQLEQDLAARESAIAQSLEEYTSDRAALDRRRAELEDQARAIMDELQTDRQDVDKQQEQLREEIQRHEATVHLFESTRDTWIARTNEVREWMVEAAERASLVQARERQLDAVEKQLALRREELQQREEQLAAAMDSLELERQQIDERIAETNRKVAAQEQESAEVRGLVAGLEERQAEIVRRERAWCDEVKRRREEIEQLTVDLDRRRALLDRQAAAGRRQVKRLREVSHKVVQRRRQLHAQTKLLERRHETCLHELESLQSKQKQVRQSILEYVEQASLREQAAIEWLKQVRQENQRLAQVQQTIGRQVQEFSAKSGQKPQEELEQSLNAWARQLAGFEKSASDRDVLLERQEQEIRRGQQDLSHLLDLAVDCQAPTPVLPTKAPARTAVTSPPTPVPVQVSHGSPETPESMQTRAPVSAPAPVSVPPAPVARPERVQAMVRMLEAKSQRPSAAPQVVNTGLPDEELLSRVERSGLIAREKLSAMALSAAQAGKSLVGTLMVAGVLTRYQLDELVAGRTSGFSLGKATILDVVHAGTVATTYRVKLPEHSQPMALRLLAPNCCRDTNLRAGFESAVHPYLAFRHPNVAFIHQVFATDNRYGVVTEFIDGASLAALALHDIPPKALVRYCHQVVSLLATTHRQGLMHRGIRPSRLLVDRTGTVKVIGFGEPEWLRKIHRCERAKAMAPYIAPEERGGDGPIDVRSDLYAVGMSFLHLATGRTNFAAHEIPELPVGFPDGFGELLLRLLSEDPARRCRSVEELLQELNSMLQHPRMQGEPWPGFDHLFGEQPATPSRRALAVA